jgi:hypothetical protein
VDFGAAARQCGAAGGAADILGYCGDQGIFTKVRTPENNTGIFRCGAHGHPGYETSVKSLTFKYILSFQRVLYHINSKKDRKVSKKT